MSFPVTLSLRRLPDGLRLIREPIGGIEDLRDGKQIWSSFTMNSLGNQVTPTLRGELFDLRMVMRPKNAREFGLKVHGEEIYYSTMDAILHVGSVSAPLPLENRDLQLRVLVDRASVEVFADFGEISISVVTLTLSDAPITLFSRGGETTVVSLEADTLESIWGDKVPAAMELPAAGGSIP